MALRHLSSLLEETSKLGDLKSCLQLEQIICSDIVNENSGRGGNVRGGQSNRGRGGRNSGGRWASRPTCQVCNKYGRSADICYYRHERNFVPQQVKNGTIHQPGNFQNGSDQYPAYIVASDGGASNSDASWYVDSGAFSHITNDMNNLHIQNEYHGADKGTLLVLGVGVGVGDGIVFGWTVQFVFGFVFFVGSWKVGHAALLQMGAWQVAGVSGLVCDFSAGWSANGSRFSLSWCVAVRVFRVVS
ncbi:hypothetical protein Patl1_23731 [Pistacia atlantica]|uniref:Uncharacterized protein n=1 Tax=Pistacia atlantica TaxID=434234 RepID=A0ACC0ZY15_9ROSI|nr:hypothetical protein Patl1_23731 [Pistacia atlantica]